MRAGNLACLGGSRHFAEYPSNCRSSTRASGLGRQTGPDSEGYSPHVPSRAVVRRSLGRRANQVDARCTATVVDRGICRRGNRSCRFRPPSLSNLRREQRTRQMLLHLFGDRPGIHDFQRGQGHINFLEVVANKATGISEAQITFGLRRSAWKLLL